MKKIQKPQFSKVAIVITGVLFAITLIHCFQRDVTPDVDLTVIITEITVTGGLFSSSLLGYFSKSKAENLSKQKLTHVKEIAGVEYKYFEKRVRLLHELGLDVSNLEDITILDELRDQAITSDLEYIDEKILEADNEGKE